MRDVASPDRPLSWLVQEDYSFNGNMKSKEEQTHEVLTCDILLEQAGLNLSNSRDFEDKDRPAKRWFL